MQERGDKWAAGATNKDYWVVEAGPSGEYTQWEITLSRDGAQCLRTALSADVECWFAKADCRAPLRWWERGWDSRPQALLVTLGDPAGLIAVGWG